MKSLKKIFLTFLILIPAAGVAVPNSIRFQGRLTDRQNAPVSGNPTVIFDLFTVPTGGSSLWNSGAVKVTSNEAGLFSTNIDGIPASYFSQYPELYLQVTVNAPGGPQILTPRQKFASVPYAIEAGHAGTADAATSLLSGSITTDQLADGAVTQVKLSSNAVNSLKIVDGSVSFVDLGIDSVRSINIQNGTIAAVDLSTAAVVSENIKDGSIDSVDLAPDAVNSDNIQDQSIQGKDIQSLAISSQTIAQNAVTSEKIKDQTILPADVAVGYGLIPTGGIIIWLGADCPDGYDRFDGLNGRFPIGTATNPGVKSGTTTIEGLTLSPAGAHSHVVDAHSHAISHKHAAPISFVAATGQVVVPSATSWTPGTTPISASYSIFNQGGAFSAQQQFLNTTEASPAVSSNTAPGTDTVANHTHAVQSNGSWMPPNTSVLFCQKN